MRTFISRSIQTTVFTTLFLLIAGQSLAAGPADLPSCTNCLRNGNTPFRCAIGSQSFCTTNSINNSLVTCQDCRVPTVTPIKYHTLNGQVILNSVVAVGISDVTVLLQRVGNANGQENQKISTRTNGSGMYSFANVAGGVYTVSLDAPPAGYTQHTNSHRLTLSTGGSVQVPNLVLNRIPTMTPTKSPTPIKYHTLNGQVILNSVVAVGISDVTVLLQRVGNANGQENQKISTRTNGSGMYSFANVAGGVYTVSLGVPPAGYTVHTGNRQVTLSTGGVVNVPSLVLNRIPTMTPISTRPPSPTPTTDPRYQAWYTEEKLGGGSSGSEHARIDYYMPNISQCSNVIRNNIVAQKATGSGDIVGNMASLSSSGTQSCWSGSWGSLRGTFYRFWGTRKELCSKGLVGDLVLESPLNPNNPITRTARRSLPFNLNCESLPTNTPTVTPIKYHTLNGQVILNSVVAVGISDVTVLLQRVGNANGQENQKISTRTNGSGMYSFANVAGGVYTVSLGVPPAGYTVHTGNRQITLSTGGVVNVPSLVLNRIPTMTPTVAQLSPTSLSCISLIGAIKYTWGPVVGANNYYLSIYTQSATGSQLQVVPDFLTANTTSFVYSSVDTGVSHVATVRAVNTSNNTSSLPSNAVTCVVQTKPSATPSPIPLTDCTLPGAVCPSAVPTTAITVAPSPATWSTLAPTQSGRPGPGRGQLPDRVSANAPYRVMVAETSLSEKFLSIIDTLSKAIFGK